METYEWWGRFQNRVSQVSYREVNDIFSEHPVIVKIFDFQQAIRLGVSPESVAQAVVAWMMATDLTLKYPLG